MLLIAFLYIINQPLDIVKDYHQYLHPEMAVSNATETDVLFGKKIYLIRVNRVHNTNCLKILHMEIIHKQSLIVNLCGQKTMS